MPGGSHSIRRHRSRLIRALSWFIVLKNGGTRVCSDAKLRNDLVEEMADVLMYYNDVLLCYGISAEELKQSYSEKYKKNMERW